MTFHTYTMLADLIEYPDESWCSRRNAAEQALASGHSELAESIAKFCEATCEIPLHILEERYAQTFDLNPVCTLEIGHYLFGEDYKRGLFLANLRETEAPYELGQAHQLPDYLPVLLRLLEKLDEEELRDSLISECLLPALDQMTATLEKSENPYVHLLKAVRQMLRKEAPNYQPRASAPAFSLSSAAPGQSVPACDSLCNGGMNTHVR